MCVVLKPALRSDLETLWQMQKEAFDGLLQKYQDYDTNPACERFERTCQKFDLPGSFYYFIEADGETVGVIRILDRKDGSRKRISPLWIMPQFRGRGYAQQAILAAEALHGPDFWSLDTILQEEGNLHLYEKLGYHRVGETKKINDRMDLVFYEKDAFCFRPMTITDYDKVYDLWMSCKNMGFNNLDDSRDGIEKYLNRNPGLSYVAIDGDRVVGIILAGHDGRRGFIHHMAVAEDHRGHKIATRLLEKALAALKAEGIHKVALLVFNRNEAGNAFWESQGFTARTDVTYRNKALDELIRIDT